MTIGISYHTLIGDMLIQCGCTGKDAAKRRVDFQFEYDSPPTVLVTPEWTGSDRNVGNEETIHSIDSKYFEVFSGNAAANYGFHWIALGSRNDVRLSRQPRIETDDWLIQFDKYLKSSGAFHIIGLPIPYARNPAALISAFWNNVESAVGHAETLNGLQAEAVSIGSNNAAEDYFVNWMTIGEKEGAELGDVYELPDGKIIQTGVTPAKASAALQVTFPRPFSRQPIVLVSPVYINSGVGNAETLSSVDTASFSLISGNKGDNYRVSWVAIG